MPKNRIQIYRNEERIMDGRAFFAPPSAFHFHIMASLGPCGSHSPSNTTTEKHQALYNMGNPLADYGGSEKVTVEHIFVLSVASVWEEPLRRVFRAWGESGKGVMKSLEILGYAASAYLVMLGASHLIDSIRSKRKNNDNDDE